MLNLEDTYKQFGERVFNIALQYLRNVEDAEEVTQDVFWPVSGSFLMVLTTDCAIPIWGKRLATAIAAIKGIFI